MEEKIKELLNPKLKDLNIFVYSSTLENENNNLFLRICLDSSEILDLDKIVEATNIINPLMDGADLVNDKYILEVYGRSKESELNEKN